MLANNIIVFPTKDVVDPLENMADDIMCHIFTVLNGAPFDTTSYRNESDVSLLFESIRSMLLRTENRDHPLQDIVDKIEQKTK